jgi:hypothetical protein
VNLTRLGGVFVYDTSAPVCSPSSSPRFHHDPANSGDSARDAIPPGKPAGARLTAGALTFTAPGDDLLCGTADHYEMLGAGGWTTSPVKPAAAGTTQTIPVDAKARSVTLRAVDEQGNAGRSAVVKR